MDLYKIRFFKRKFLKIINPTIIEFFHPLEFNQAHCLTIKRYNKAVNQSIIDQDAGDPGVSMDYYIDEIIGIEGYDYDDWKSNEEAFIGFSLAWFMVIPILLVVGMFRLLVKISTWYLKL